MIKAQAALSAFALGLCSATAWAGNGLNDYAFGARAYGMAGADLAIANDATATNTNPAGLTQMQGSGLDLYFEPFTYLSNRHRDSLGNDRKPEAPYSAIVGGGFAHRLNPQLVIGAGFFGQGGAGLDYEKLNTVFGSQDEYSSKFGTGRFIPGIAWQASPELSLGLAIGFNYSMARQKLFPNTSVLIPGDPAVSFSGLRADSLGGWSINAKTGFQYRPTAQWVIAGAYTSESKIKLENGTVKINGDAQDLGRVTYGKASQTGLAIAQEAGLGFAYRANETWLISAELNWLDWSSAMKQTTLKASRPNNPAAAPTLSLSSPLNWRDQYVIAAGAEYRYSERTTLRFGLNYGRNPIPGDTLNPVLSAIGDKAVAVGFSRKLDGPWEFSAGLIHQIKKEQSYQNPQSPVGSSGRETWDGLAANLMLGRRW